MTLAAKSKGSEDSLRLPTRTAHRAARGIDLALALAHLSRPIVFVSGFWRSGTTWVQELLANSLEAKTVFEPLSPQGPHRYFQLRDVIADKDLREAYIPGPMKTDDPVWSYLDRSFQCITSGWTTVTCRQSIMESFRHDIVVKDVRLQPNLAQVHARYGLPVIHVRRHPCGVVSSLIAAKWDWSFARVSLPDIVAPFIDDFGADSALRARIAGEFDADAVSRIAAYWAITESLAARALEGMPWARIILYERTVETPEETLADLCRLIGRAPKRLDVAGIDSATTIAARRGTDGRARAVAWRARMSAADTARVIDIVQYIFPGAVAGLQNKMTTPAL